MRTLPQHWAALCAVADPEKRPWLRTAGRILRWVVPAALVAYLAERLTRIGWTEVWDARPQSWVFYGLLVVAFFLQPLVDKLVYANLWRGGARLPFVVLLRKRFLNTLMIDYSGEAYLFAWARGRLGLPTATLGHAVKDSNVLSAGAGLVTIWLVLLVLVAAGAAELPGLAVGAVWFYAAASLLPLVLCGALVAAGARVTTLTRGQLLATFALHLGRSLAAQAIQLALWLSSGALASPAACLEFVALRLLVSRLPFVPGKDMIFVGAGLAAAGGIAATPAVAAVLVLVTASELVLDLVLVGLPWLVAGARPAAPARA
jgi:hypothetical protein